MDKSYSTKKYFIDGEIWSIEKFIEDILKVLLGEP